MVYFAGQLGAMHAWLYEYDFSIMGCGDGCGIMRGQGGRNIISIDGSLIHSSMVGRFS
jgi:hypothetical protein